MKTLKTILLFLWLLPQNIIGLIVFFFTKLRGAKSETYNGTIVTRWKRSGGISLGQFIFVPQYAGEKTIKHEYGHYIDGTCLGWLYGVVIGIPSFIWAGCFGKYRAKHNISYYDFYTEKRADLLGEVNR